MVSENVEIKVEGKEKKDTEELREVFKAITDFLKDIKEPIMDIINTVMESMKGDKLGDDVSQFYKRLKDAGMPEDLINEMTKKYFEERLVVSNLVNRFLSTIGSGQKKGTIVKIIKQMREEAEEEEENEE